MKTVKEWCWMHYEQYLVNEWIQCRNEGRDVDDLKELCEFVERESRREGSRRDFEAIGAETGRLLVNSAVKPGYAYNEPSDYESILDARPEQTFSPVHPKQSDALRDRIAGAWAGRIAGCLIGKPFEGWRYANIKKFLSLSGNMPMRRYARLADFTETVRQHFEPNPEAAWADNFTGASPADDDTTYTVIGLKTVESFGRDFLAVQALESWLRYMPIVTACTAERITYCNAARGLVPPETARYHNPYREYIGAQIRADFYGYCNPGDPFNAASMAYRDASISHTGNGIYGEMWVAAMIAIAAVSSNIRYVVTTALEQIPANCRLAEAVWRVVKDFDNGTREEEAREKLYTLYNENIELEWGSVITNAAVVAHSLLYGGGDFAKTAGTAVMCGYDTDCNGATAGSVVGMLLGKSGIPAVWYETFSGELLTSVEGYNRVSVDSLTEKTMSLLPRE